MYREVGCRNDRRPEDLLIGITMIILTTTMHRRHEEGVPAADHRQDSSNAVGITIMNPEARRGHQDRREVVVEAAVGMTNTKS